MFSFIVLRPPDYLKKEINKVFYFNKRSLSRTYVAKIEANLRQLIFYL